MCIAISAIFNHAYASENSCKTITNKQKRLECYENQDAKTSQATKSKGEEQANSEAVKSANEAIKAVRGLLSRVKVGVTYRDYGNYLGDTQVSVDQFLNGKKSQELPTVSEDIKKSMHMLSLASEIWSFAFGEERSLVISEFDTIFLPGIVKNILEELPDLQIEEDPYYRRNGIKGVNMNKALSMAWKIADDKIKSAESHLK